MADLSVGVVSTKKIYMVDPKVIKVEKGWNHRFNFDDQDEIENSIMAGGVEHLPPLLLQRHKDGSLILRDGERRLRAVSALIKKGVNVIAIPAYITRSIVNPEEFLYEALRSNDGSKKYLPIEQAEGYKRLLKLGNDIKKIAHELGKSPGHIRGCLTLLNGCNEVKEALSKKEIPTGLARQIIESSDGDKDLEKSLVKEATSGKVGKKMVKKVVEKRKTLFDEQNEKIARVTTLITMTIERLGPQCSSKVKSNLVEISDLLSKFFYKRRKNEK